jgi:hypothetical protein
VTQRTQRPRSSSVSTSRPHHEQRPGRLETEGGVRSSASLCLLGGGSFRRPVAARCVKDHCPTCRWPARTVSGPSGDRRTLRVGAEPPAHGRVAHRIAAVDPGHDAGEAERQPRRQRASPTLEPCAAPPHTNPTKRDPTMPLPEVMGRSVRRPKRRLFG